MTAADQPVRPPWLVLPDYQCFGCSPHNASGLRLEFWQRDGAETLETPLRVGREHESYPGVVHGGIVATVCDETMGNLVVLGTGVTHFTVTLRMRFVSPLAIGADYRCVASLRPATGSQQRQATAEVLDAAGHVVATASGTYQPASEDQARQHLTLSEADRRLLDSALTPSDPATRRNP